MCAVVKVAFLGRRRGSGLRNLPDEYLVMMPSNNAPCPDCTIHQNHNDWFKDMEWNQNIYIKITKIIINYREEKL